MSSKIIIILGIVFCVIAFCDSSKLVKVVLNKNHNGKKHHRPASNSSVDLPPCQPGLNPGNKMAPCVNMTVQQGLNGTVLNTTETEGLKIVECDKKARTIANISRIEVSGCSKYPCLFKRGDSPKIKVLFTPSQRVNQMSLNIGGIIQGKKVPFPYNDNNHCVSTVQELKTKSSTKCILNKNTTYTYEFSMPILSSYPAISLYVNYNVKQGEKNLFCFLLPVKIV
ncbi:unnamed protein product [Brachionus calyciflorus]|uniref:MD-2-related lipid-recognition domain-containing protein n=1 Tax=Brachionus calyciflorus TaxID=104777 RepID=A0A814QS33_9BILA|nr:unnamed protein product [Brachionus calyciflorus]